MKRFISFILCFFLLLQLIFIPVFNIPVYGAIVDIDPDVLEDIANNPEKYEPTSIKLTEFLFNAITGGQAYDKFFGTSSEELLSKVKSLFNTQGNVKTDGDNYYLTTNFINEFNKATQDSVHALDGYYLCEPTYPKSFATFQSVLKEKYEDGYKHLSDYSLADYNSIINAFSSAVPFVYLDGRYFYYYRTDTVFFLYINNSSGTVHFYDNGVFHNNDFFMKCYDLSYSSLCPTDGTTFYSSFFTNGGFTSKPQRAVFGAPFKLFYSRRDLENYLNNGQQRTYAPKLPNVTIKIPVKYINNSVSLPDITYNITTENKTETEIQNQYDTTINNYLNSLDDFSDGSTTTPTPTPSGGFTDSTTPTPTPPLSDGSDDSGGKVDLSEITDLLNKILDKLTSFADSHSKFEQTITDYIESTDGKLDQIIEAIDSLSDGKTEDEKNGCKYDFSALSDFMTDLWNESDKKFDTMIDLLEENNKYQHKLVNSLNEIKAILITQTVLDLFTDRSSETANKAKEKFPTSLPWDIALVVNAMSAEPEKLKFTIPVKIESLNINEEINIDLTSEEWEKLAKTCRYLLSILFILFMIHLSRKLFSSGGDD